VTQEDFEMAVAKVMKKETEKNMSLRKLWKWFLFHVCGAHYYPKMGSEHTLGLFQFTVALDFILLKFTKLCTESYDSFSLSFSLSVSSDGTLHL